MSDGISETRSPTVQEGGVYRHFKGGLYVALAVLRPSGDDITYKVGYMSLEDGKRYWRNYSGHDGFTTPKIHEDGKSEERYVLCGFATVTLDDRGVYSITHKFK